jgi:hypothetical protein
MQTERQTDRTARQTDLEIFASTLLFRSYSGRQVGWQAGSQAGKQEGGQTGSQEGRGARRQAMRKAGRGDRNAGRQTEIQIYKYIYKQTEIKTHRHTHRQIDSAKVQIGSRQTDRCTERRIFTHTYLQVHKTDRHGWPTDKQTEGETVYECRVKKLGQNSQN